MRDGLKPVHRRILFGMNEMGLTSNAAYRKCAKIVGDSSRQVTIRTATRRFTTRWCAWRSLSTCATRWSMAREISARSMAIRRRPCGTPKRASRTSPKTLLADIEKETVDFIPNFDETAHEPVVLPTRIPNLLVNGASGIAVGMATNIPPHNLKEIVDADDLAGRKARHAARKK